MTFILIYFAEIFICDLLLQMPILFVTRRSLYATFLAIVLSGLHNFAGYFLPKPS
jgi:hypothetical protein